MKTVGSHPKPVSSTERPRQDLKKRSYGGGELGDIGVTPIEMSAFHGVHSHGISRTLVMAITDYVDERLAMHVANTIRQGITSNR